MVYKIIEQGLTHIIISNKYIYINYIRRLIKLLNYILYKMSDKQM